MKISTNIILGTLLTLAIILALWLGTQPDYRESFETCPAGCTSPTPVSIGSIINKYSGIAINLNAVNITGCTGLNCIGTETSTFQIVIPTSNPSSPLGVLVLNTDGSTSIGVSNANDSKQLWKLVKVNENTVMDYVTSGTPPPSVVGSDFFYYVIPANQTSTTIVKKALQYENGSISVRILGQYETQMWLANPEQVSRPTSILNSSSQFVGFSPELVAPSADSNSQAQQQNNIQQTLNTILNYIQSNGVNATPSTSPVFGGSSSVSAPLNVNVRVGGNIARLLGVGTTPPASVASFSNTDARSLLDQYNQQQLGVMPTVAPLGAGALSGLCETPNMSDYVSKVGIPCTACANF